MPWNDCCQKRAVVPSALPMPIRTPANGGARSRWLTRKPLYWKPQNASPTVMNEMAPGHCVQSMKPLAATMPAGTMPPAAGRRVTDSAGAPLTVPMRR